MYCALLLILLHCCKVEAQENVFTINNVVLHANPAEEVNNGNPVILLCSVDISKSDHFQLNYTFSFLKSDEVLIITTLEQDWAEYKISRARFSDSGEYECMVNVKGKTKTSNSLTVQVKGIMKPILIIQKKGLEEGEDVRVRCEMPEEKPPLYFTFFKILLSPQFSETNKTKHAIRKNFAETEFKIAEGDSILYFECSVKLYSLKFETSERSERELVTVVAPFSTPEITIHPNENIIEGDKMSIKCVTILRLQNKTEELILQKDKKILNNSMGTESVIYTTVATMEDSGNYTCKVERGKVSKSSTVNVEIGELFSKPELLVKHSIVRKMDFDEDSWLQMMCRATSSLPTKFLFMKDDKLLKNSSEYSTVARVADSGAYACMVEIKGIVKKSDPVWIRVHAPVSKPDLSVASQLSEVVLGKNFTLRCYSKHGTPPITYTLYRTDTLFDTVVVHINASAEFRDVAISRHVQGEYKCEAKNGHSLKQQSSGLNISVIDPVYNVTLTSYGGEDMEDSKDLIFFCTVSSGSLPIKFKFFRKNKENLLHQTTEKENLMSVWHKEGLTNQDAGKYFCTADNQAKLPLQSNVVNIKVTLASWKKVLIVSCVLLFLLASAVLASWWYFHKKARAKNSSTELTRSTPANNSIQKLTSKQNDEGEFYYGSEYNEDSGNQKMVNSKEDNTGLDLENAEVEYTEVEVSVPDPSRAPVTKKTETVYTEIRKATNDAGENRNSIPSEAYPSYPTNEISDGAAVERIEGFPDRDK